MAPQTPAKKSSVANKPQANKPQASQTRLKRRGLDIPTAGWLAVDATPGRDTLNKLDAEA
jgi:hypothetical protein